MRRPVVGYLSTRMAFNEAHTFARPLQQFDDLSAGYVGRQNSLSADSLLTDKSSSVNARCGVVVTAISQVFKSINQSINRFIEKW